MLKVRNEIPIISLSLNRILYQNREGTLKNEENSSVPQILKLGASESQRRAPYTSLCFLVRWILLNVMLFLLFTVLSDLESREMKLTHC